MFEIPSEESITKVVINKDTVANKIPETVKLEDGKRAPLKVKKSRTKKGPETA